LASVVNRHLKLTLQSLYFVLSQAQLVKLELPLRESAAGRD